MSSNKAHAIENAIMPRDPKVPAGFEMLASVASLSFCPVKSAERRERGDHIARLISETLVSVGV
jgi:hypothetical protein